MRKGFRHLLGSDAGVRTHSSFAYITMLSSSGKTHRCLQKPEGFVTSYSGMVSFHTPKSVNWLFCSPPVAYTILMGEQLCAHGTPVAGRGRKSLSGCNCCFPQQNNCTEKIYHPIFCMNVAVKVVYRHEPVWALLYVSRCFASGQPSDQGGT